MKYLTTFLLSISILVGLQAMERPSFHTKGSPTGKASGPLKPGEYWWNPKLSPQGPVVVLVSIPQQTMHVYRNGILIGRSSISSGSNDRTPAGVFSILQKSETYRSKKYDNAPMPNMQRLTWTGIAMHSGQLPGYAASHGCIRLPYDFSQLLFNVTSSGGTVVIGDDKTPVPYLASNPGLVLAPKDFTPEMLQPLQANDYQWQPERGAEGPMTIVLSSADRAIYVYRSGNPIGRASVEIKKAGLMGGDRLGNHVFTQLEGTTGRQSTLAPGHETAKWMCVSGAGRNADPEQLQARLRFNPEFGEKLAQEMKPGTTVIVTDDPIVRRPKSDSSYFASN